jgi:hypothetical protein
MDYSKNYIQIACAGSGKTYSMSELVLKYNSDNRDDKDVIVITYTNFATKNIVDNLLQQTSFINPRISVSTIHSFLLERVIYPFSNFVLGIKYNTATSIQLPSEITYKNKRIKELEQEKIIHNEIVFKRAKQILCNGKNDSKELLNKKKIVLEYIESVISAIFLDEAQDIDEDMMCVLKVLSNLNIRLYLVGDTKQALRKSKVLLDLVLEIQNKKLTNFHLLPNNNVTRRLPINVTNLSNIICDNDHKQTTISSEIGNVLYVYSDEECFKTLFDYFKKSKHLIYTHSSTEVFTTSFIKNKSDFWIIRNKFKTKSLLNDDFDATMYEKEMELQKLIDEKKSIQTGLSQFLKSNDISLSTNEYAIVINSLSKNIKSEFCVTTIDKVKGLEDSDCMFIINNSLLDYFFKNKEEWNKEKNYLYVINQN